jgi:hypothetical protein
MAIVDFIFELCHDQVTAAVEASKDAVRTQKSG